MITELLMATMLNPDIEKLNLMAKVEQKQVAIATKQVEKTKLPLSQVFVIQEDNRTNMYNYDEIQKYYKLDCVDRELYTEAMIVKTEWQKMPEAIMFQEFPKNRELNKRR